MYLCGSRWVRDTLNCPECALGLVLGQGKETEDTKCVNIGILMRILIFFVDLLSNYHFQSILIHKFQRDDENVGRNESV